MSDIQYDDLMFKVESILFAAGKFMDVEHIASLVENDVKEVKKSLKKLKDIYEHRPSCMRIVEEDKSWKMTVIREYVDLVSKIVSDTELSKTVLETLAVVAWKSPILQSEVIRIRTSKAYEHIKELVDTGYIVKEPEGRSYRLRVTEKFFEYFDIMDKDGVSRMFKDVQQAYDSMMKKKRALAAAKESDEEIPTIIEGDKLGKMKVYTRAVGKDDVIEHDVDDEGHISREFMGLQIIDMGLPDPSASGTGLSHLDDPDYIRYEEIKKRQAVEQEKAKEDLVDIDSELSSISSRNEKNKEELQQFRRVESPEEKPKEEQSDVEDFLHKIDADINDISDEHSEEKKEE